MWKMSLIGKLIGLRLTKHESWQGFCPSRPHMSERPVSGLNGSNGLDFKPDHEPLKTASFNGLPFKLDHLDHQERWTLTAIFIGMALCGCAPLHVSHY